VAQNEKPKEKSKLDGMKQAETRRPRTTDQAALLEEGGRSLREELGLGRRELAGSYARKVFIELVPIDNYAIVTPL
jgi:hypothetical protein